MAAADETKAVTLQVRLRPESRERIEAYREKSRVPATEIMAAIIDWFVLQDPSVQKAVIEREDANAAITRQRLAEMAVSGEDSSLTRKLTHAQAAQIARRAIEQMEAIQGLLSSELARRLKKE